MARIKRKSPRIRSTSRSSNQEEASFKDSDRATLNKINESVKDLKIGIRELKLSLVKAKKDIAEVKAENARLKQAINRNIYGHDDLEHYNRRENIRNYGVPKFSAKKDGGEQILFEIADELDIKLDNWDIQQCHRLGKKPRNGSYANSNNRKAKSHPYL